MTSVFTRFLAMLSCLSLWLLGSLFSNRPAEWCGQHGISEWQDLGKGRCQMQKPNRESSYKIKRQRGGHLKCLVAVAAH